MLREQLHRVRVRIGPVEVRHRGISASPAKTPQRVLLHVAFRLLGRSRRFDGGTWVRCFVLRSLWGSLRRGFPDVLRAGAVSRLAPLVSVSICRWFGLRFDAAGDSQVVGAVAVLETRLVRLEAGFDLAG